MYDVAEVLETRRVEPITPSIKTAATDTDTISDLCEGNFISLHPNAQRVMRFKLPGLTLNTRFCTG
jgi:hypothetical protein